MKWVIKGRPFLDWFPSLQLVIRAKQGDAREPLAWRLWERWISEIVADFWSVGRVGVVSTLGLIGVVSLPRPFVFRINVDDPHPVPWIRVKLSCAIGNALYPTHPQWQKVARLWESYYPVTELDDERRDLLARLEASFQEFVVILINHRPKALRGPFAHGSDERRTEDTRPACGALQRMEQGAAADVSRAAIAGFGRPRPGESRWRP